MTLRGSQRRRTDIVLVFCPLMQTTEPHLAVPHLATFLTSQGFQVAKRDLSLEFHTALRDAGTLSFLRALLRRKATRLSKNGFDIKQRYDYLVTHVGLAALDCLQSTAGHSITLDSWPQHCRCVFAVQAAFGFDLPIHNDYHEFVDDLYSYLGVDGLPHDTRLGFVRRSTIAQIVTSEELADRHENLFLDVYEQLFLADLLAEEPLAIGLSIATNEQVIQALSLARLIREHAPGIHITVGGSYVRYLEPDQIEELLRLDVFDSIAPGRGETPLLALLESLRCDTDFHHIPGLAVSGQAACHCERGDVASTRKTAALRPDYDGLDRVLSDAGALSVLVTDACYWGRCTYCNYTGIRGAGYYRPKAPTVLVDELASLQELYGISYFNLIADSISPAYASHLSDALLSRQLRVELSIWARGERHFSPELCKKMSRAGFRYVTLGVESLCDRILNLMGKGTTVATNLQALKNMTEAGIRVQMNIIMGFPGETSDEAFATFNHACNIRRNHEQVRLVTFPFSLQRGSTLHLNPEKFGLRICNTSEHPFRPKNIFVPFSYTGPTSFHEVFSLGRRYHGSPTPVLPAHTEISCLMPEHVGHSCMDFSMSNGSMERRPVYTFVNFQTGVARYVTPSLGFALASLLQPRDSSGGLLLHPAHASEVRELQSAGILA